MGLYPRTKSKHSVSVLNLDIMKERATKFLKGFGKLDDNQTLTASYAHGLVEKDGFHFLIDTEGVGSKVPLEKSESSIEWYIETYDDEGKMKFFDVCPSVQSSFDYNELMTLATVIEIKPLNQFI